MDAFEFVKARGRMCNVCQTCAYCPLDYTGYCSVAGKCRTDEQIERAIEIVEKWAKEHPLRTRQSEFLNPAWISVEDGLPDSPEPVLCWYEYFRCGNANRMYRTYGIGFYFGGRWNGEVANGYNTQVLYWMPLPKPPKGADNEIQ